MELVLGAKSLDRHGFLVDIVEVDHHLGEVAAVFQDKTLNALTAFAGINPSIERLVTVIHDAFREGLAHAALDLVDFLVRRHRSLP